MTDPRRTGDDPTLPDVRRDDTAQVLLDEPFDDELAEQLDTGEDDDDITSFAVKLDAWRRHYLPLPDEVVHEYLGEDEYVVHTDHPSFRAFLIKNSLQVFGLGAVFLVFMVFIRNGFDLWTVLLFLILQLILAFMALKRLSDRYTSYVITNLRLIRLSGVFGRKLASIPWTRMTGLGYRQRPLGRILGYATIFIESANEESGLREFSDINDPAAFHQKILDMMSAKSGQSTKDIPPPTRGERKSFLHRRKERRAASLQRARSTAREIARSRRSRKSPDGDQPTDLPQSKRPVRDGGDDGPFKKRDAPLPPKGDAPPGVPEEPEDMLPPDEPAPSMPEPPTPRNRFWPGAGGGDDPARPSPIPPRVEAPPAEAPPRPARPPQPKPTKPAGVAAKTPLPTPPAPAPKRRGFSLPTRPPKTDQATGAPPTPPATPAVAPKRRGFSLPTRRTPPPAQQPTTAEPAPKRRGFSIPTVRRTPTPPPPTTPPKADAPKVTTPSAEVRSPRVHRWWRNYRSDETSARDALAALREGQRQTRPARRVRLPNFGRTRSPLPESRQLPAGTEHPPADTADTDDAPETDDN